MLCGAYSASLRQLSLCGPAIFAERSQHRCFIHAKTSDEHLPELRFRIDSFSVPAAARANFEAARQVEKAIAAVRQYYRGDRLQSG